MWGGGLCFLFAPALFAVVYAETIEFETVEPGAWTVTGPSPRGQTIELLFAVKQQNLQKLHDTLMAVSDPKSPSYGHHLSNSEVNDLTSPQQSHITAVMDFLKLHDVEGHAATPNLDMIAATVPVETAEKMLSTRYVRFEHNASGVVVHRTVDGYSLPTEVMAAVDFVAPTTHLPGVSHPKRRTNLGNEGENNDPKNLRQLYSIGDAVGNATNNKQAVTAFLGQHYSQSALKMFFEKYCSDIKCGKGMPKLVGDATKGGPGVESMLDIEYITGVGGNIETEFWGFSGRSPSNPENEPFMKWLAMVSNTSDAEVPLIFSSSYGEGESTWSYEAGKRLNAEFMKAGARGISLLFASGDSGATCTKGKFTPNMPASSPYVTAVGGTQPTSGFPSPGSESAVGLSSGGFSNYWPMPDWQKDAVEAYLKQPGIPTPAKRGYNVSGRGFPDIAAQAVNFCVTPFGCGVAGTSCASPTAAGVIGLLNDLRLQKGKSSLGFLNPLLYSQAEAFTDITTGASDGCGLLSKGWPATKGWDAVTGLGTPDYSKLAHVIQSLPGPAPEWHRAASAASIIV